MAGHDDHKSLTSIESCLMDSLESTTVPAAPTPVINIQRQPRIWKFWGTALWGLFVFAAMFVGQIAVVAWFVLRQDGPFDVAAAIRVSGTPFADYLALRWTSWTNLLIGAIALSVLVMGWDLLSRATGREVEPGFMGDVLKSASADGALWLLVIAFCVEAPISEEFFA